MTKQQNSGNLKSSGKLLREAAKEITKRLTCVKQPTPQRALRSLPDFPNSFCPTGALQSFRVGMGVGFN